MKKINILFSIVFILLAASCSKDKDSSLPTLTTNPIRVINDSSVAFSGTVTTDGGSAVISRGFAIAITPSPTIAQGADSVGSGTGTYIDSLTGFVPGTTYYVRAFARNSKGLAYGNEISFTTNGGSNSCKIAMVNKTINSATRWSKDSLYVVDGQISVQATLTIEAGTIIKFKTDAGLKTTNSGNIQAVGISSQPIIFTAYSDDSYCGDNNGDGTATTPRGGYWGGICLQANVASKFNYCEIYYTGADVSNAAGKNKAMIIRNYAVPTEVDHCTIAHTSGGTSVYDCAIVIEGANPVTVTNNKIYDNGGTVYLNTGSTATYINSNNIFHNPNNASQKNVQQAIVISNYQLGFTQNTTLSVTEVPFHIMCSQVGSGIQVTLVDGVILKFEPGADFEIYSANNGGFINGQGPGVTFTSIRDDVGGDSNGDGSATSPAAGDWKGIYDGSNGSTHLTWSNIIYDSY